VHREIEMIGTGAIDRARELPPADELHRDGDAATDEVAQDEPEPHALTERGAGVRIAHAREHGIHRRADPVSALTGTITAWEMSAPAAGAETIANQSAPTRATCPVRVDPSTRCTTTSRR
jgi:hypothetical protein